MEQLIKMEELIEFKVKLLEDIDEKVIEVRRFNVLTAISTELDKIKYEMVRIFPHLKNFSDFVILWKDSDGDMITVNSDEELKIAMNKMSDSIKFCIRSIRVFDSDVSKGNTKNRMVREVQSVLKSRKIFIPNFSSRFPMPLSPDESFRQNVSDVKPEFVMTEQDSTE